MAQFTTRQMMDLLLSDEKWYVGFVSDKTAATYKHRHLKGILTDATYEKIFAHFGFAKHLTWTNGLDI